VTEQVPTYNAETIAEKLTALPGWSFGDSLSTHSAGGVTDFDLAMARKIDDVVLWKPGADTPLRGTTRPFVQGG